ncbi:MULTISPECIES: dUTP diphosphatase [unclassified Ureibacillus]|uniref:dUTP diphosphatase n=1 Tax=unclassified Ureibacillus TaxID=2638520 RepID=UPI0030F9F25E
MNYPKLFEAQRKLDDHIITEKNLQGQDLFHNKIEALLCEIQECANETRCFKHWSNKEANMENALEEAADSFHFILSIGNDLNIKPEDVEKQKARIYEDLTLQFIILTYTVTCMAIFNDKIRYYFEAISIFKGLMCSLKFTENQLEEAYYKKNKVNYERQASNY